jgi:hypothetical protein
MLETHGNDDFMGDGASGGAGSAPLAIGGRVRVARLETLSSVRGELARLYRECRARAGRYPTPLEGQRLASILGDVRGLIELQEIQARLTALEQQAGVRP